MKKDVKKIVMSHFSLKTPLRIRGFLFRLAAYLVLCSTGNAASSFSSSACMRAKSLSRVQLSVTPWTAACQAPLSLGFSRQGYCSGLPCPPPGHLPNQGLNPALMSPALASRFFITSTAGEALPLNFTLYYMPFLTLLNLIILTILMSLIPQFMT